MPSRTLEDKVEDLSKMTAALAEQVKTLQEETKANTLRIAELTKTVAEQRTAVALLERQSSEFHEGKTQFDTFANSVRITLALLERAVEELKKTKEEWSRRVWAMIGPILGAVVGVLLGYFLQR